MSKYSFVTSDYKPNETWIVEIDIASLLVVNKTGSSLEGVMVGRKNDKATVTITRSSESTPTVRDWSYVYSYNPFDNVVRNQISQILYNKYGRELTEKCFDEFVAAQNANNSNKNPFCSTNLPVRQNVALNSITESGGLSPVGSGYGSECSNVFNDFSATPFATNDSSTNNIKTYRIYWLFDFMKLLHDSKIYTFSSDVLEIINENATNVTYETSFIWDVYIVGRKESALKGGYVTNSVIVRWSCDAVNKATEYYLAEHPNYEYRADNTIISLSAKKLGLGGFSDPFYNDLYGTLEANVPITKLTEVAGISDFMKNVSAFIPSLDTGDVALYLRNTFENLYLTDTCMVQIPLNKTTADTKNLQVVNGKYGSYVRLHYGRPDGGVDDSVVGWNDDARDHFDDDSQQYDDDSEDVESDIAFNSNISLLTTTYTMTESNLKKLGGKLWSPSFYDVIKQVNNSPIENILSVKSFPFQITTSGEEKNVILGNVDMEVVGREVPSTFIPVKTVGTFSVSKKFSEHLEWLNFSTKVTCYLPYIGFVELPIAQIIDKTITLKYIYDIICGVCTACFYANGIEFAKYSGTVAIDIPITSSNRAQVEAGLVRAALSGNVGALGNIAAGSLLTGDAFGLSGLWGTTSFTTKGSPSPSCDGFDEQKAFAIVDYPVYYEPTSYGHIYGYPCNISRNVGDLSGYTEIDNVDMNGLSCTEEEKEMLKSILENGFYV